ncbi:hypothetical protein CROQUDRAFT_591535 [Cronartium quercuum f. sp. fusiforme G11]|uniref:Uncharacterized protein n=1 Tax=Cronartium quercuum f. sp. fusiforme G11 TaxID=708437 RepID=A0A9P6NFJ3_9BASI|nr:hypothetical protein CROQUDRAFT_591535 [Cronartium quercuum f. sp. fusiforme G11]
MDPELIPIYLVVSLAASLFIYFLFRYLQSYRLKKKNLRQGIGRGVAGIQTSVRRVAVPPEIMERIRRGEEVSAEEITRAQERMAAKTKAEDASGPSKPASKVNDDWLSPSATSKRSKNPVASRKNRAK